MTVGDVLGYVWLTFFAVLAVGLVWAAWALLVDEPRHRAKVRARLFAHAPQPRR